LRPQLTWSVTLTLSALPACQQDVGPTFSPAIEVASSTVAVAPRIPELRAYPCWKQCHQDLPPNPVPRDLEEFHHGKQLAHGGQLVWCAWCHTEGDLDRLHLLDGTKVTFDQAYRLCGQCHGEKLRDWTYGIHGRQTGSWSGLKVRASCPTCHNPHRPKRPPLEALPPPHIGRDVAPSASEGAEHGR
jgi:hypothetical protein